MKLSTVGLAGQRKAGAAATPPSTPTITSMANNGNGQDADIVWNWSSNNGGAITTMDFRWATNSAMTISLSAAIQKTTDIFTSPGLVRTTLATAAAGAYTSNTGSVDTPASMPANGVAAWYQIRMNNSAGSSAWSTSFGPITTA